MSSKLSAPQSRFGKLKAPSLSRGSAQMEMSRRSSNLWRRVRSTRGSGSARRRWRRWRRSVRLEQEDVGSGIPSLSQVRLQKHTSSNYNGTLAFRCVSPVVRGRFGDEAGAAKVEEDVALAIAGEEVFPLGGGDERVGIGVARGGGNERAVRGLPSEVLAHEADDQLATGDVVAELFEELAGMSGEVFLNLDVAARAIGRAVRGRVPAFPRRRRRACGGCASARPRPGRNACRR